MKITTIKQAFDFQYDVTELCVMSHGDDFNDDDGWLITLNNEELQEVIDNTKDSRQKKIAKRLQRLNDLGVGWWQYHNSVVSLGCVLYSPRSGKWLGFEDNMNENLWRTSDDVDDMLRQVKARYPKWRMG